MLITFKSKSSPNLLMYEAHAKIFLDLLHKSPIRGVITAAQASDAIALLEKEIADRKLATTPKLETIVIEEDEDGEKITPIESIDFAVRAFPFLQMLRSAKTHGNDIVWGV